MRGTMMGEAKEMVATLTPIPGSLDIILWAPGIHSRMKDNTGNRSDL